MTFVDVVVWARSGFIGSQSRFGNFDPSCTSFTGGCIDQGPTNAGFGLATDDAGASWRRFLVEGIFL
jgi:hypothetical protein